MIPPDARPQQLESEFAAPVGAEPVRLYPAMVEIYHRRVRELVAGLSDSDPIQALIVREAVRALVDRLVLTPSAEDPRELTVDLEGVLAQLFWLGLDRKGCGVTAGCHPANKKAAPFRGG